MNASHTNRISPTLKGYLLVFAGAACISFAGFFVKDAPIDVSMVAFYRLLFGSVALFLVAFVRKERIRPPRAALFVAAVAGFLFCCDILVWHHSITLLGPGIATIVANFQVFFLALFGVFFLGQPLTRIQKAAMPLALVGLSMLLDLHRGELPVDIGKGTALCLLSALFYSAYILVLRRSQSSGVKQLEPVTNMAWVSVTACACVGVFCLLAGISFAVPDGRTIASLAILGVLCQALGWLLLSIGLPYLPPFRAGLVMLIQPALAFLWDMLLYGTATGPVNILGAALAISAIGLGILSQTKPAHELNREPVLQASLHPAGESGRFRLPPVEKDSTPG